jgi:predicted enzyme related to lactoylglutathione lyase
MHLNGAVLFVKDLQRMRDFYGRMLQKKPLNEEWTDSHALFDLNGDRFVLHAIPDEYACDIRIASPPEARERNPVKIIFAVEDVPSERSRLAGMGVTMLQRPWQNPTESCDGVDPEGNVFQIAISAR